MRLKASFFRFNFRIRTKLKIATYSTDSQKFSFVVETQSKQKSEIIELETYFFENCKSVE